MAAVAVRTIHILPKPYTLLWRKIANFDQIRKYAPVRTTKCTQSKLASIHHLYQACDNWKKGSEDSVEFIKHVTLFRAAFVNIETCLL
jgi:hypothetical protein